MNRTMFHSDAGVQSQKDMVIENLRLSLESGNVAESDISKVVNILHNEVNNYLTRDAQRFINQFRNSDQRAVETVEQNTAMNDDPEPGSGEIPYWLATAFNAAYKAKIRDDVDVSEKMNVVLTHVFGNHSTPEESHQSGRSEPAPMERQNYAPIQSSNPKKQAEPRGF